MLWVIDTMFFTLDRMWQHRLLVLWVVVGLTIAVTLSLGLTLYVDSVYTELLETRLATPPYAFRWRYLGAWNGNISQADVESARLVIQEQFAEILDLPTYQNVFFVRGGLWASRMEDGMALGNFSLGTLQGAESKMQIVQGVWPAPQPASDMPIPVLIPESMFYRVGLQIGDELTIQRSGGGTHRVLVVAIWRPIDSDDKEWIFAPKFFDEIILVEPATLWQMLEGVSTPIDEAAWFTIYDGRALRTSDVGGLLARIVDGQRNIERVLPGIRVDLSPAEGLTRFNNEVNQLTQQLFILIAPIGGLVLYFVSLMANLLVSRQQAEDVKLRSRGMSRWRLVCLHLFMWLLFVGFALLLGILLSPLLVSLVGRTSSFLRFEDPSSVLEVVITEQALWIAVATGFIAASSGLWLTWRTARQNVNSFQRASVRSTQAWWQRAYLDVLLVGIAVYVFYTLVQQGGLVANAQTPFSAPLTFVGPTLFALGFTLLMLRLWPMLLNSIAFLLAYTRNIAFLMTLRELTRSISRYRGALLMMSFTLSLTGFTASMASTLDQSLRDTIDYQIGADVVIVTAVDAETEASQDEDTGQTTYTVTGYNVPPVEGLLAIEGVASVSRVGEYPARLAVGSQRVDGVIVGVDRASMAAVTRFREDYAAESLAALLNKLAGRRTGILLNRQIAQRNNLIIGQEVVLQIQALNTWYDVRVPIVDFVDYFPTLDPNVGFFAITNLDPIFELVGTVLPYDVWLRLYPSADAQAVRAAILASNFPILRWLQPETALQAARAEPSRRGVLGFLSVGFVAAIALTLTASIIQSTASFRAQAMQLGALRAMGLGGVSVAVYIVLLQGILAISGVLSGTLIGAVTTLLFLPLLDFSGGLPPYLVRVAWDEITLVYIAFAGVLLLVTLLMALLLGRQQVATIVRLGDVA